MVANTQLGHRNIETGVRAAISAGALPVVLGGDHSISLPVLRAFRPHYRPLTILHIDAHPDLYDEFKGNRNSHACPFARIMEEQLAKRLVPEPKSRRLHGLNASGAAPRSHSRSSFILRPRRR